MTPEDIRVWRLVARKFSLAILESIFYLIHNSASQDVTDYEIMRRWSACKGLAASTKLRVLR